MTDEQESLFRTIKYSLGDSADHLSMGQLVLMTDNLLNDLADNHWIIVRPEHVKKDVDMEETTG